MPEDPYLRILQPEFHEPVRAAVDELTDRLQDVVDIMLYVSVARGKADRRSDIELVALTLEVLEAAADLRSEYQALNVFDGVHLGSASVLGEPIVSTDTLFPEIPEIDHLDPPGDRTRYVIL